VVVKSLVARLGGVIHIEKFGLNGIRLVLDFNFTRVEQEFTPKQEPIQIEKVVEFGYPDFRGKRALLADDDPISRAVGVRLLDKTGIETTEVSDGFEAVEAYLASDGDYDVILMDIRMPELNGLKATRKIRESNLSNSETIPIIAITVNAFEKDMQQSFSAGMNAHLVKPIDKQSLYEILEKYLLTENNQ
jgi:CheY-like chemotaxis protein